MKEMDFPKDMLDVKVFFPRKLKISLVQLQSFITLARCKLKITWLNSLTKNHNKSPTKFPLELFIERKSNRITLIDTIITLLEDLYGNVPCR